MKITRTCDFNGNTYTMDIPVLTPKLLDEGIVRRNAGEMIQDVFHYLTADEREFLMTGTPPEIWDAMFGEESGTPYIPVVIIGDEM